MHTRVQVIVNVIERKLSIADAIVEPRLHHQWWPDEVVVERGFSPDLVGALKARGHAVVEGLPPTSANSILVTPAGFVGAADNRTRGALAAGGWSGVFLGPPLRTRARPLPVRGPGIHWG